MSTEPIDLDAVRSLVYEFCREPIGSDREEEVLRELAVQASSMEIELREARAIIARARAAS